MSLTRVLQVNSLIQKEISEYWERELEFPKNTIVSVTRVETTSSLDKAFVYISVWPQENQEEMMEYLSKNIYHTQQHLNKRLHMRRVPLLILEVDEQSLSRNEVEDVLDALPDLPNAKENDVEEIK